MEVSVEVIQIGIIQIDLVWEAPQLNRERIAQIIRNAPHCNLYLLPEFFPTAFSPTAQNAETMRGESVQWMQALAKEKNAVIAGSLAIVENDQLYNRFLWVKPENTIEYYDKHHLFSQSKEALLFTVGSARKIVQEWGWNFSLQICYDLRFPCWSMNTYTNNTYQYDVLLYVASWPKARQKAWTSLLQARAIENQAYSIGVNRVGTDGNGFDHSGFSQAYDPKGECLYCAASRQECGIITLNKKDLTAWRLKFPVAEDWNPKMD